MASDGNLLVADTHYYRLLTYQPDGTLLPEKNHWWHAGNEPSQFHFVTDVVQDNVAISWPDSMGTGSDPRVLTRRTICATLGTAWK